VAGLECPRLTPTASPNLTAETGDQVGDGVSAVEPHELFPTLLSTWSASTRTGLPEDSCLMGGNMHTQVLPLPARIATRHGSALQSIQQARNEANVHKSTSLGAVRSYPGAFA